MFALMLQDEFDSAYSTLQVFDDPALWDWMHQELSFPLGVSSYTVPLPSGYTLEDGGTQCDVTSGSGANDLMHAASDALGDTMVDVDGELDDDRADLADDFDDEDPDEDELDDEDPDEKWAAKARAVCAQRGVRPEHIATGLWY